MAKVHFAKNGLTKQGTASTTSATLNIKNVEDLFSGHTHKFSEQPPRINPKKLVNEFSSEQHVVIEIEGGESTQTFPDVGYYFLPELSVTTCKEMIKMDD